MAWLREFEDRRLASLALPPHAKGKRGYVRYRKTATANYYETLCEVCPQLREHGDFALKLTYLLDSGNRRNDGVLGVLKHPVPTPSYLSADMAGEEERERAKNGNFPHIRYLEEFADIVKEGSGGAITVKFSDYRAGSHCTYCLYLKVPKSIKAALRRERDVGIMEPLVELRTGEPATRKATRAKSAKEAKAFVEEAEARSDVPEIARRLLYYLVLTLPLRPFAALLKPDFIKKVEAFIKATFAGEPASRRYAIGVCQAMLLDPKPLYHTSPKTVRLSPYGLNIAMLQSEVRKYWASLAGWIELDLSNAQLAINAVRWNVQSVIETLRDPNYSVWPDLIQHLGGDVADIKARGLYERVKDALKAVVYGLSYGMGKRNLGRFGKEFDADADKHRRVIEEVFGMKPKEAGRLLLQHPLIAALLEARKGVFERVLSDGGLTDCFGRWIKVEGRTIDQRKAAARSALAQAAQAEEMAILAPVIYAAIDEAKKARPLWRIVLWQHDGFSLWFKEERHRKTVVANLQQLVAEEAGKRGIPTRLEVS
ncbi:MAG: hypothetical protein ABJF88_18475 [Rhodothermales bacterium]